MGASKKAISQTRKVSLIGLLDSAQISRRLHLNLLAARVDVRVTVQHRVE